MKAADVVGKIRDNILHEPGFKGVRTGLKVFDELTGGLRESSLILLASRPVMGKTDLLMNIIENVTIDQGKTCVVFDLDAGIEAFIKRYLLFVSRIGKTVSIDEHNEDHVDALFDASNKITSTSLYVYETASIDEMETTCRKLRESRAIDLVIIDVNDFKVIRHYNDEGKYLYNVSITDDLIRMRMLAKELKCPVLATKNLPRAVDKRKDKRPRFKDLSYPDPIVWESCIDEIIFLYRDDYYFENENKDIAEITVAYNRNGCVGTMEVAYLKEYGKFMDLKGKASK